MVRSPEKSEKHEQNTQRENTHTHTKHSEKTRTKHTARNTHTKHSEKIHTANKHAHKKHSENTHTHTHTKHTVENTKLKARIKSEKSTTELGSTHPIHFFVTSFQRRKQTRASTIDGGSSKSTTLLETNQRVYLHTHTEISTNELISGD